MAAHHDKRFPGEGNAYRGARDTLLAVEKELPEDRGNGGFKPHLASRGLPKEDYAFTDCATDGAAKLS